MNTKSASSGKCLLVCGILLNCFALLVFGIVLFFLFLSQHVFQVVLILGIITCMLWGTFKLKLVFRHLMFLLGLAGGGLFFADIFFLSHKFTVRIHLCPNLLYSPVVEKEEISPYGKTKIYVVSHSWLATSYDVYISKPGFLLRRVHLLTEEYSWADIQSVWTPDSLSILVDGSQKWQFDEHSGSISVSGE